MHSCTHWLRPATPAPPLGSYTRALLVSQDRRLFVTHWVRRSVLSQPPTHEVVFSHLVPASKSSPRKVKSNLSHFIPEPVFVDLLRSPGIDSQHGGPVPTTLFVVPARQLAESVHRNRFLGSINVYKYELCIPSSSIRLFLILSQE